MLTAQQIHAIADESHANRHVDAELADMWRKYGPCLIAHGLDSIELIKELQDVVAKYRDEPPIAESDVVIDAPIGLMLFTLDVMPPHIRNSGI